MAKRGASKQLTHDNWDDEEEPEEVSGMKLADASVLAKRPMKKAKRRVDLSANSVKASPFSAFKGFGTNSGGSQVTSGFTFGTSKPTNEAKPLSSSVSFGATKTSSEEKTNTGGFNFISSKPTNETKPIGFSLGSSNVSSISQSSDNKGFSFGGKTVSPKDTFKSSSNNGSGATFPLSSINKDNQNGGDKQNEEAAKIKYGKDLTALNQSVSAWIKQHIDANPVCDLSPVFDDYKKHIDRIEKTYHEAKSKSASSFVSSTSALKGTDSKETKSNFGGFSFGSSTAKPEEKKELAVKPTFNFGAAPTNSMPSSGGVFSFSGVSKPVQKEETKEAGGDEDEPPKVEFTEVKEEDALFSRRAKIFYKHEGSYKEKGVGMLHVKAPGGRGQLFVRADTNLGNVILNLGIPKGMPSSRQGKNNVVIMSPLNPPVTKICPVCKEKYTNPQESNACPTGCTPPSTAILLRVKTSEDADELLKEIEKLK